MAKSFRSTVRLADGTLHPVVGFGTYKVGYIPASASSAAADVAKAKREGKTETAASIVEKAITQAGYRFLDCAQFYGNEAQVGDAIRASGVPRSDLFLASKVWCDNIYAGPEAVRAQVEKTLSELGTDYIDLYMIHWPVPGKHIAAYKMLEEMQREKKIKSIGLSNYTIEDFEELVAATDVLPVVNQIEINPFLFRRKTIDYFKSKGVVLQAYRALRNGAAFQDPTIVRIATKHGRTPAQILGRFCVQNDIVYIPKSIRLDRMIENKAVFDFCLDDADMDDLYALTCDENLETFRKLYVKCVVRDTPMQGTLESIKTEITLN